jgi:glycosyltransferase involved in cell wall biosynthesis
VPFKKEYNIKGDYIVYVGRIDSGKGCNELLEYFDAYKKKYRENLNLVLVGKGVMPVPKREDIIELGFVSDLVKFAAIANAKALVLPSRQESLGIVVLEAMALGVPVLLNAHCAVLKAQAEKSDAGLYFYNQEDFIAAMRLIIERKDISERFGENGKKFVEKHYKWDVIIAKICDLVEKVCADE